MGCGPKACADDEEDWKYLKKEAKITGVTWDVYSPQATHAETGFNKWGLKGQHLRKYVEAMLVVQEAISAQRNEDAERKHLKRELSPA